MNAARPIKILFTSALAVSVWLSLYLISGSTKNVSNNSVSNSSKTIVKQTIYRFFFFIWTATLLCFSSCENDLQTVNAITGKNNLPSESLKEVEIIYSERAKVLVKLDAPTLNRFATKNPYLEFPDGVHVLFYDSLQKEESNLKAGYAIRREKEKTMEARKNVEIINRKGEKINTEQLTWDEKSERIYTRARVKITTAKEILFGEGFESDQFFDHWIINKPTGTIILQDE
ncbi:MAG: LPS export ABC transporter periplasmic protein LptC [Bacteroidota bacterium]